MFSQRIHRYVFLFGTILIVVSFTLSPFLLSIGHFVLATNWLVEPGLKNKFRTLLQRKSILYVISIFGLSVIWLINTSNFQYAWQDLIIKLPILLLPIIYGTSQAFNRIEFRAVLHFFLASILLTTFISLYILLGFTSIDPTNPRDLSPIISHIRFSLFLVLATYILLWIVTCKPSFKLTHTWVYLIIITWFLFFILVLGARTGPVIFIIVFPFSVLFWLKNNKNRKYYYTSLTLVFAVLTCTILFLILSYNKYMDRIEYNTTELETHTISGNKYSHKITNPEYENKHRVWLYICDVELKKEWNKHSKVPYLGKDGKGQIIRSTLIRYMTSKGFKKDSVGFNMLTNNDIELIEHGFTNYIYAKKWSPYTKIHEIFWEIEHYIIWASPNGHSITQRLEYLKNASRVIQNNFWFGVGTGDVRDAIDKQYKKDKSNLNPEWRLRAHNQLVTYMLTFGLFGFLWFLFAFYKVIKLEQRNIDFVSVCFMLIFFLSMLDEDTLETQAGVSFFTVFISLLIFARRN